MTEIKSRTFLDISGELDKTLTDIQEKKKTLDHASNAVTDASNKYNDAVTKALELRSELAAKLNESLPNPSESRVRQS